MQMYAGFFCYLTQARQEFDAINRPVRHFFDAGTHTRDVEQQESKGHETGHPNDLPEDLLQCHGHNGKAERRKTACAQSRKTALRAQRCQRQVIAVTRQVVRHEMFEERRI